MKMTLANFEGVSSNDEYDLTMDAHHAFPEFPFDFQTSWKRLLNIVLWKTARK
jgi:hypothetical protein